MFWGLLPSNAMLLKNKVSSSVNSMEYQSVLFVFAIPAVKEIMDNDYIFKQDTCSVHIAQSTLKNREIDVPN